MFNEEGGYLGRISSVAPRGIKWKLSRDEEDKLERKYNEELTEWSQSTKHIFEGDV